MSKQLGNSPDALGLIDTLGQMRFAGPALSTQQETIYSLMKACANRGKTFLIKYECISVDTKLEVSDHSLSPAADVTLEWYETFNRALEQVEDHFSKYISDALKTLYKLVWDDFCSRLLEAIKTPDNSIDILTKTRVIELFENNLRVSILYAFLTEELWHFCGTRTPNEALMISQWPKPAPFDKKLLDDFDRTNN